MGIFMRLVDYAEETNLHSYSLIPTTLALCFLGLFLLLKKEWSIHGSTKFPIVGIESPGYLGLTKARDRYASDAFNIVKNGYYKYRGKNFVVTTHTCYKFILTQDQVKELSNFPDDFVSFQAASSDNLLGEYTGLNVFPERNYVQDAVRIKLTQNLGNIRDAITEEMRFALHAELPEFTTDEWRPVEIFPPIQKIVARAGSRAFVGLPLCRNEDWLTVSTGFTSDVITTILELANKSKLIRPFYAWMYDSKRVMNSYKKKAEELLTPSIQARLEAEKAAEKNGEVYKKPNDMLQWLTDVVEPQHKTIEALSELQLLTTFASIITTSNAFLNTLYDLAAHQECVQPIREEIEAAISANGGVMDRAALRKMKKTDSFFKESMRKTSGLLSFSRKVMKSFTLSDGTYLRKGTTLAAPAAMLSTDPDFVEDPETFDGFRWYKKSLEAEGLATHNTNMTTTSTRDLVFGHGKHACPGRFFAGETLKTLLAFIILQYDFKYPEGESRPPTYTHGEFTPPDITRKLLFKKLPGPKKFSFL